MSYARIEQVKKRKPFALWDILVYGVLAVFVVVLFIAFVFTADKSEIDGIRILLRDEEIYSYSFEEGGKATAGWESRVTSEESDGKVILTVWADDAKEHFNRIEIDLSQKSVKVTDANCSRSPDCELTELQTNSGSIICVPHSLKILSLSGKEDFSNPNLG